MRQQRPLVDISDVSDGSEGSVVRDWAGRSGDGPDLRAEVGHEFDVLGEKGGRWYRERRGLPTAARARAAVDQLRLGTPDVIWHVVRRTTTVAEDLADDLLEDT